MGTAIDTSTLPAGLEHAALLVDRSERGKLALSGAGAIEFLNGQVTNELVGVAVGEGRYAAFLNHKGGMLGDLRILHARDPGAPQLGPALLLDTERSALQALFDMIREYKVGFEVELHKRTLERSLVSLVGGEAARVAGVDPGPREHDSVPATLGGVPALAIRTAFGVDLYFDADGRDAVLAALTQAGARAHCEGEAERARVELGVPVFGVDIPAGTIPQEAGLNERAVSFTKGCYVGQETVARLYYKGTPKRHLRGLRAAQPLQRGASVSLDGRELGTVTSVAESPVFGAIALALLRKEATPGTTVELSTGDRATVTELPFTDPDAPRG